MGPNPSYFVGRFVELFRTEPLTYWVNAHRGGDGFRPFLLFMTNLPLRQHRAAGG
jgi:hypothetical protein